MALRFIDSFDHYTGGSSGSIVMKWTSEFFSGINPAGLHGKALNGSATKGMLFPGNTIIMEAFIKRLGSGQLFALSDTNPASQISCGYSSIGQIFVNQWAGAQLFLSEPDRIRPNTWYHFAWKVFVHPSAGTVEVRLNGETICNLTGVRTTTGLGPAAVSPYWSGTLGAFTLGDNSSSTLFDDLVVMDDVADGIDDPRLPGGGGFSKFLGPVEIVVKRPNGAGDLTEWVPSPTVANHLNVDDLTPDLDATFNSADRDADGTSDLLAMENMALDEDVVAVQSLVLARKTEEGIAAIAKLVKDAGATLVGPTVYQPNTYSYMIAPEPSRPSGGLWTIAAWDAIQYGYRRIL